MSKTIRKSSRKVVVLSVVIPTRDRADLLTSALDSLTRQTLAPDGFEVLVIDNGSTDHTAEVVDSFLGRRETFQYFYEPEPGLHAGRHRGMLEAKGEVLVFADDDIEALPSWLSSIQEAFSDHQVAMVGGNNMPLFMVPPPAWLLYLWKRSSGRQGRSFPPLSILELTGSSRAFSPHQVWGCNFAIRKDVLLAAGGFHPDGMPQELRRFRGDGETHVSRYVAESGKKCIFHPGASVYHKVTPERMTFSYFRQRGFNQGISDSYASLRDRGAQRPRAKHNALVQYAKRGYRKFQKLILVNRGARYALREMRLGRGEGFLYHQQQYAEDASVRQWVHKLKYFREPPE